MAFFAFPGMFLIYDHLYHADWIVSFSQVGVPYLRAKAQDYFEALGGGIDSEILDVGGVRNAQERMFQVWRMFIPSVC